MARFRQTSPYWGKGRSNQAERARSLIELGLLPPGDYSPGVPNARKAVVAAERAAGLRWSDGIGGSTFGHVMGRHD